MVDLETGIHKPYVDMSRVDGNVFAIIGAVRRALVYDDQRARAAEFVEAAKSQTSYDAVLQLLFDYVDPGFGPEDPPDEDDDADPYDNYEYSKFGS